MPRISADGKVVAFSYQGAIWWIATSGGPMKRLTHGPGFDVEPAWSPDGQQIAWISGPSFGVGKLAVQNIASREPFRLPTSVTVMDKLHFDRDGRRILGVFQQEQSPRLAWYDLQTGQLHDAIPAGSWPGTVLGAAGFVRQKFALSNENHWLAVITTDDVPGEQEGNRGPGNDVWIVSLEGGPPQRIVRWPARIHDLCWRADDQALFVVTERGGVHLDLWEIPLRDAESGARKLSFGQADEASPSVSSNGKWLAYTDNRHGATQLMLRDLASGDETIITPSGLDFASACGQLSLRLLRMDDRASAVGRVVVRHADGKFHAPPGSLYRVAGSDMHFYVDREVNFSLPVGRYSVKVWHGPEFVPAIRELEIRTDQVTSETIELERWTNQRVENWICGESHIHANYGYGHWYNSPATVRLQCAGENLIVANCMVANSDGDGVYDREFFLGRPDPLSTDDTILYWNEEFRSTIWGHMTLLNLKHLVSPIFTGFDHTTHPYDVPTNADIADHTHDQDGLVNYTHPAHNLQDPYASAYSAKEMPIDVALGRVDSIDVMGSNHEANLPLWYRMLNCGLRLPASAGTDCFINRIASRLPGADRVYVHCSDELSYGNWIENLRAGRTFVTNGPMLRFTVNGQEAGSVIAWTEPGPLRVHGEVHAHRPIERLEVVVNGKVLATANQDEPETTRLELTQDLPITGSVWIALRAAGSGGAFAHTSAVYVEVPERPVHSREDAEYFIKWIERLWQDIRARNRIPAAQQVHVEQQFAEALGFYRRLAAMPDP
jgi:hypothetical protein